VPRWGIVVRAQLKPRIDLDGRTPLETVIPLATPFIVFVDPASACNFKCRFCPTGHQGLIDATGRFQGVMKFDLFRKIVDDFAEFDRPIKVLRLYKDGEPFLNRRLADMVAHAKKSGYVERVDTTTNGSLITPARLGPVLEAGIDRINISVDGMDRETYRKFTGADFDVNVLAERVRWLYENRGRCEVVVKIPSELVTEDQRREFFDMFGDHCDRIFVENFAPCWPGFDVEGRTGVEISRGIYQQDVGSTEVCPYIFYGYSVNADGLVSACFLDWGRKLIIGDARESSMREIWNSASMNALRLQHLRGERKNNSTCGGCGQLTHCLPDNIDAHREVLLSKFENAEPSIQWGFSRPDPNWKPESV
jgi:radical SAM protein with 4Fe4S-binding SPASM domain